MNRFRETGHIPGTGGQPPASSVRGFTLVELVVIAGILAILAVLLLSTLKGGMKTARTALCASNQRQLVQLFNVYAQEHNGSFPQVYRIGSSGHWYYNADILALLNTTSADMWAGRSELYLCPSDTNGCRKISIDGKTRFLSYAANINLGAGEADPDAASPFHQAIKTPRLAAPSKLIMLCDADDFFFVPSDAGKSAMSYRHRGGLNVAFADGHVEWHKNPVATNAEADPQLWWPDGTPQ